MNSRFDGNWNKIKQELGDVAHVWRTTRAEQSGWTHEVMQKTRDLVRHAPVTVATILVFGLIAFAVAVYI